MKLKINIDKMKEIYGDEIADIIDANIDIIEKNIELLRKLNFADVEDLFERCPDVFMNFPKKFEEKILKLKEKLGEDFVEKIQNDISIFEKI